MKQTISIVLVFAVIFSSAGGYACAKEIGVRQLSQDEVDHISAQEADSAPVMDEVMCGESENGGSGGTWLIVFAVIGVLAVAAAVAVS